MNRTDISEKLRYLFKGEFEVNGNFVFFNFASDAEKQQHTNDSFSDKWSKYSKSTEQEVTYQFQRDWYLTLYGFADEEELREHLRNCTVIFDAGCGLGYKSAWLAELAPHALVIGMDFSEAVRLAAETYAEISNLFFIQGDIVDTGLHDGVIDYVNCDQVIMQTSINNIPLNEKKIGNFSIGFRSQTNGLREIHPYDQRMWCQFS
jgi:SAM-dependent methyltransferase